MRKKVFVAMSGGVDSSVAALLLKRQGYEVTGITMQIWPVEKEPNKTCCGLEAIGDAQRVARKLNIPHYVMNFRKEFASAVVDYFCREYMRGKTPNPCIACNRFIKFGSFLTKAVAMGADFIATGHYADIKYNEHTGQYYLVKSRDASKDQTYTLYGLTQDQLKHTLFPVGGLCKEEVRNIARQWDLPVAEKVDSQDICFVNKAHYTDFVEQYLGIEPNQGLIVDSCGCVRGYHTGVHHFTIGQRKGLGLALGYPVYVRGLDPYSNTVKVGTNQDLYDKKFVVEDVNYIVKDHPVDNHRVEVKIRYSPLAIPGSLIPINQHNVMIDLDYSVRAVTPGQAAVFYQEDTVIGGGTISRVLNQEV